MSDLHSSKMIEDAANKLRTALGGKYDFKPTVAIICGTGLGGIRDILSVKGEIPFSDIPGFKSSTVVGHSGKLLFANIGKISILCMLGRLHTYEGYDIKDTTFPVRVFAALGVETVIVTNAAGGINPEFSVGDIMILDDHINIPGMAGLNPLKGPNDDSLGPRFPPLSDAYDHGLRQAVFKAQHSLKVQRPLHEGTYAYVSGPNYETRAEVRFLRAIGADAVGMSTVPEILVARHSGMKVLALSLITNAAVYDRPVSGRREHGPDISEGAANHEEVLEVGKQAAVDVQRIVQWVVSNYGNW